LPITNTQAIEFERGKCSVSVRNVFEFLCGNLVEELCTTMLINSVLSRKTLFNVTAELSW
jgi:hypothetical protein